MPTLIVVRHAKAAHPAAVADVDRPLRDRGHADARAAGNWLRSSVGRPARVISSPARRARQTAEELLASWGEPDDGEPAIDYVPEVYEASVGDLLGVLAELAELDGPPDLVVLVGHNPSVSGLVATLTGESVSLRTCGIAVVQVDGPWTDLHPGGGRLLSVSTPRAG